jgi:hypothetical protein
MWQNQLRWAQTTRYSRPRGQFGSGLIFAMPYGIVGFFAAAGLGHWGIAFLLLAVAVANRLAEGGWWDGSWCVIRGYGVRPLYHFTICAIMVPMKERPRL